MSEVYARLELTKGNEMKRQQTKSSNEIMLLVNAIKNNRGLNNLQAVSFLSGLLYSYATQENIDEIFTIVSKENVGR
jgi:hypothetical protein